MIAADMAAARERLEELRGYIGALIAIGATSERLSLHASASKRLARMFGTTDDRALRHRALRNMREMYDKAYTRSQDTNQPAFYALVNRLAADAVLCWQEDAVQRQATLDNSVTAGAIAASLARLALTEQPGDFWAQCVEPDCALALALTTIDAAEAASYVQSAIDGYRAAFEDDSSPSDRMSVLEHLDFLRDMAKADGDAAAMARVDQVRVSLGAM